MWQLDLLHPKFSHLRAELAEKIAKEVAIKKLNMIVERPQQIINKLVEEVRSPEILTTPEFRFLKKYQKTMDFFAIWPRKHPNLPFFDSDEIIRYFFTRSGLLKYTKEFQFLGYALEVKSFILKNDEQLFNDHLTLSDKQQKLIEDIKNNPFLDIIFAKIGFWGNYKVNIKFLSAKRKILSPREFTLTSPEKK